MRFRVYFEGKTHRICRSIQCRKDKSCDDFTILGARGTGTMKLPFAKMGKTRGEASSMGNRCSVLEMPHLRWRLNPHGDAKPAAEHVGSESRDEVQAGDITMSIIRI